MRLTLTALLTFLTLTLCARTSSAQCAEVTERLADGGLIVAVGGREYRAITADQARELVNARDRAERVSRERDLLDRQALDLKEALRLAKEKSALDAERLAIAEAERDNYRKMYEEADRRARRPRVKRFFDHPVTSVVTRGVIPLLALVLAAR
jgi:replicative DNA helicase